MTYDPFPTVLADGSQLGLVFQNLISNALKFHGPDPVRIHIASELKDREWLFAVRDNGIGLEPKFAERIFVIFQRPHTSREYSGTGLGLAISKNLSQMMGGDITFKSTFGQGTTFTMTLPLEISKSEIVWDDLKPEIRRRHFHASSLRRDPIGRMVRVTSR